MRIGYFSQDSVSELTKMAARDIKLTALRYFAREMERERGSIDEGEMRACLASFGLQGKTASETPVALLSGGQKVCLGYTDLKRLSFANFTIEHRSD
jgi:ATP-binding cassette subfamily F protein 3